MGWRLRAPSGAGDGLPPREAGEEGPTAASGAPPGGFGVGEGKESIIELGDTGNEGYVLTGRRRQNGFRGKFRRFFP